MRSNSERKQNRDSDGYSREDIGDCDMIKESGKKGFIVNGLIFFAINQLFLN